MPTAGSPRGTGGGSTSEGYLFLEGRVDDVIVRGGENMSPGEIEDVLLEHAAVADCAVVGMPGRAVGRDRGGGGRDARATMRWPTWNFRSWVKDRLRSSRAPSRVEFWTELPYNETGKATCGGASRCETRFANEPAYPRSHGGLRALKRRRMMSEGDSGVLGSRGRRSRRGDGRGRHDGRAEGAR